MQWLEGFAYRTSIEWWMLALAFCVAIGFALSTIFVKCLSAASADR